MKSRDSDLEILLLKNKMPSIKNDHIATWLYVAALHPSPAAEGCSPRNSESHSGKLNNDYLSSYVHI